MTNQEAIKILQSMITRMSKTDGGDIVQALHLGKLALLALDDIAAETALPEITRLRFVDGQAAEWFPAAYESMLEWNTEVNE